MKTSQIILRATICLWLAARLSATGQQPQPAPATPNATPATPATAPAAPAPASATESGTGTPPRLQRVVPRALPTPSTNAPATNQATGARSGATPAGRTSLFPAVPGQTTPASTTAGAATNTGPTRPIVARAVPDGSSGAAATPAGEGDGLAPGDLEGGVVQMRPASGGRVSMEDIIKTVSWNNAPLDQVLEYYSGLTARTVLRPANLTGAVTIKFQSDLTRREAIEALDSVLALNGITMINRGEKFVKAVLQQQALQEAAAFSNANDKDLPEAEQFTTQIVQLKNAKPSEIIQALTPFSKNPTGLVAIDSGQLLIIRDYAANVKRIMEVLKKVDVVPEMDYQLEVIAIKYGKVEEIYNTMSSLIGGGGGGGIASGSTRASTRNTSRAQFGTAALQQQRALPGQAGGAAGVAAQQLGGNQNSFQNRLNQLVNRAAGGNEAQLLTDAKIIPDERSNSLIVFANKQDLKMITNIVSKVDVALAQVMIEAIVLEVTLGDNRQMGVSYLQRPQSSGKFTGAGGVNNGQPFINPANFFTSGSSNSAASPVGIGNLGSGFSYFGTFGNDFDVAVSAIAGDSTVNVMSRPRIVTSHAVPGSFFVGDTVPYITGTSYGYGGFGDSLGGNRSTYTQLSVGIQLDVTPFITPDGLVVMDLQQNIEQLGTTVKIDNNDVPTTVRRTANATVSVRDRDTIMLGGFINSNKTKSSSGVPGLMKIPVLGNLFKSRSDNDKRVELIVLMRPVVLKSPKDAAILAREELERLPGVRRAQQEWESDEKGRLEKAGKEYDEKTAKDAKNSASKKKKAAKGSTSAQPAPIETAPTIPAPADAPKPAAPNP